MLPKHATLLGMMKRYYLINDEMFVDGVFTAMLLLKPPAKRQHYLNSQNDYFKLDKI